MRLGELTLHNFGRHADTTLDLSDISFAAVTGMNGSGKSTFFVEAPLWVLKKRCRVAPSDLMKEGTTDMFVRLVFPLNKKIYKVERTVSTRTKRGSSSLSFTIKNGDEWKPVGDDPQAEIDALIPEYDLLMMTAFAAQKKLGEFTEARPGERRAALAKILAGHYSRLKKAASDHVTVLDREIKILEAQWVVALENADKIDAFRVAVRDNEIAKADTLVAIANDEGLLRDLNEQKTAIEVTVGNSDEVKARCASLRERKERLGTQEKGLRTKQEGFDALILQGPGLQEQVNREAEIHKQKDECDLAILQCGATLETAARNIARVNEAKHEIDLLDKEIQSSRSTFDTAVNVYEAETMGLLREQERDKDEMDCLPDVPCDSSLKVRCPLTSKAAIAKERYLENKDAIDARPKTREAVESAVAVTESDVYETLVALRGKRAGRDQEMGTIAETLIRLEDQRTRTTTDRARLQTALTGYTSQLVNCGSAATELVRVKQAEESITEVTRNVELVIDELSSVATDIKAADEKIQQSDAGLARMHQIATQVATAEHSLSVVRDHLSMLATKRGQLDEQRTRAQEAVIRSAELSIQLRTMRTDRNEYGLLVKAYTDIPILIIEASIPMLEHEANVILERIADDGMQIRINTQRGLKRRDAVEETLDIVVQTYERVGVWETFSGGELTRADLAIRIALAMLISHRAGAPLELLVLDEAIHAVDENSIPETLRCFERLSKHIQVLLIAHRPQEIELIQTQIHFSRNGNGTAVEIMM